ncbi:hypothetical protein [Rubrivirga sp.]|uniref:hypothetical protein n=1 Tax=Rubrivirga sp. TaxID=1885344 RepID=UPI003B516C96
MPRLALVLLVLLAACGPPDRARQAVIESATVTRLPLDRPWDSPTRSDWPDVYVDVRTTERRLLAPYTRSVFRTDVRENVSGDLPITFGPRADQDGRAGLRDSLWLDVSDSDNVGDDLMFTSGTFALRDYARGQRAGTTQTIRFSDDDSEVSIVVRWE